MFSFNLLFVMIIEDPFNFNLRIVLIGKKLNFLLFMGIFLVQISCNSFF